MQKTVLVYDFPSWKYLNFTFVQAIMHHPLEKKSEIHLFSNIIYFTKYNKNRTVKLRERHFIQRRCEGAKGAVDWDQRRRRWRSPDLGPDECGSSYEPFRILCPWPERSCGTSPSPELSRPVSWALPAPLTSVPSACGTSPTFFRLDLQQWLYRLNWSSSFETEMIMILTTKS